MEDAIKKHGLHAPHTGLFINHTLVNRDSNRIYFFARSPGIPKGANSKNRDVRIDPAPR